MRKYIATIIRGITAGAFTILLGGFLGLIFPGFYVSDLHLIWQVALWSLLVFIPFSIGRLLLLLYYKIKKYPREGRKFWDLLEFVLTYIFSVVWQALFLDDFESYYALVYGFVIAIFSAIAGFISWYDSREERKKKNKKRLKCKRK